MIAIPTLQQIYASVLADLEAEMNVTIPVLGKSFLRALAAVQAAKLWLSYKALANVQKNTFADTADPEAIGGTLERYGRVKLGRNPFPAVAGQYTVQVVGTLGAVIPAQTTFKSDDSSLNPGKLFVLDTAFTLDGTDIITLRALESGMDSKLSISDTLTVTGPIALVNAVVTVLTEAIEPQAPEEIEEYRQKIIESFQLEPQGGAGADFRLWAGEVQGVNQSYPYAASGLVGEINLYIEATIADSTDGYGTPSTALLDAVEENIEVPTVDLPARKPLSVFNVNYLPVSPLAVDINIDSFDDLTVDIETLIENALTSKLELVRPFVDSIDVLANKNDIFDVNNIISTILEARPGSIFGAVTLTVDGNVVNTFTFANGDIPYLGTVSFT
jgi:hypothetical protein